MDKHIILCLDRTPTMKAVEKQIRESVRTFAGRLQDKEGKGSDEFYVTEVLFADRIETGETVSASRYKPSDCAPLGRGGKRAAEVLKKVWTQIRPGSGRYDREYILFITDNSLEPTESRADLHDIINSLNAKDIRSFAAGFLADGFEADTLQDLTALLSFFPGGKSRILKDEAESRKQMEAIVDAIAEDRGTVQRRAFSDDEDTPIPI